MNGSGSLEAIAEEMRNLECKQKELGASLAGVPARHGKAHPLSLSEPILLP